MSSILKESMPSTATMVYQRRRKSDMFQKQFQSSEPEVITEKYSSIGDSQISDTCDTKSDDLSIYLRSDKKSRPSLSRYIILLNMSILRKSLHIIRVLL